MGVFCTRFFLVLTEVVMLCRGVGPTYGLLVRLHLALYLYFSRRGFLRSFSLDIILPYFKCSPSPRTTLSSSHYYFLIEHADAFRCGRYGYDCRTQARHATERNVRGSLLFSFSMCEGRSESSSLTFFGGAFRLFDF